MEHKTMKHSFTAYKKLAMLVLISDIRSFIHLI